MAEIGMKNLILKKEGMRHVVMGVVYAPNSVDSDGEFMTSEAVREAAYSFMVHGNPKNIDIQHNFKQSGCCVVETFIARKGDPDFPEGAWVMAVEVTQDVWEAIKKGELNGFSLAATVKKLPVVATVEITTHLIGQTEKSLSDDIEPHQHQFELYFDEFTGRPLWGETDEVLGHTHIVRAVDATETAKGHSHRIVVRR